MNSKTSSPHSAEYDSMFDESSNDVDEDFDENIGDPDGIFEYDSMSMSGNSSLVDSSEHGWEPRDDDSPESYSVDSSSTRTESSVIQNTSILPVTTSLLRPESQSEASLGASMIELPSTLNRSHKSAKRSFSSLVSIIQQQNNNQVATTANAASRTTTTTTTRHYKSKQYSSHSITSAVTSLDSNSLRTDWRRIAYQDKGDPIIHMGVFWEHMLLWDFLQDLHTFNAWNNSKKPTTNTNPYTVTPTPTPLPNQFDSPQQYKALWAPLLIHETQAQILSDLDSSTGSLDIFPVTVSHSIRDVRITNGVLLTIKASGYALRDAIHDFSFNELVVLSSDKEALDRALRGNSVETRTASNDSRFPLPSNHSGPFIPTRTAVTALVAERSKTLDGLKLVVLDSLFKTWTIQPFTEFYIFRLGSNVTAVREFQALSNFDSMPLMRFVLSVHIAPTKQLDRPQQNPNGTARPQVDNPLARGGKDGLGIGFRIYINAKFNQSQKEAIIAAATEYGDGGFTLVKGPPGSGKTTTLIAIINALHLRQYQRYYSDVENVTVQCESIEGPETLDALMTSAKLKPRILCCAPSNAAVDNVVSKIIKDRFIDGNGGKYNPSILRVGSGHSTSVSAVSLQTKIDSVLKECSNLHNLKISTEQCQVELNRIEGEIRNLQRRIRALIDSCPYRLGKEWEIRIDEDNFDATGRVLFVNHITKSVSLWCPPPPKKGEESIYIEDMPHYRSCMDLLVKYVERRWNMCSKLDLFSVIRTALENNEIQSIDFIQQLETRIIDSTDIILTTLGSTGSRAMEFAKSFEVVVIDEAAQSSEMSSLTALQLGSSHAVLVGDPNQLPATIFSISGRLTRFDRSLFQRLEEAGHVVHMLNLQYRCHPKISSFPRRIFYEGSLLDGPNVLKSDYGGPLRTAIEMKFPNLQPLTIFDLKSLEEREHKSLCNIEEAYLALHIFSSLNDATNGVLLEQRFVCIITPYSQQVSLLKKIFQAKLGHHFSRGLIEINTVDAFQGNEREIVIFSAVRATNKGGGIGFLNDVKRMNVALTRAKHYLFIIARCDTILVNPYWRDLVSYVREDQGVLDVRRISPMNTINFPALKNLEPVTTRKASDIDRPVRSYEKQRRKVTSAKSLKQQAVIAKKQVLATKFKRVFSKER